MATRVRRTDAEIEADLLAQLEARREKRAARAVAEKAATRAKIDALDEKIGKLVDQRDLLAAGLVDGTADEEGQDA